MLLPSIIEVLDRAKNSRVDTTNLLFHNEFLLDFEAVVKHAKKLYPKNKIGSFGFSMGGYFPVITKMKLDFIMADSPLISPKIFLERLGMPDTTLPNILLNRLKKKCHSYTLSVQKTSVFY